MQKGFTLLELLGVIVIIAVVSLIIVPVVGNIIEKSKKDAFLRSIDGIKREYEYKEVQSISGLGSVDACSLQKKCNINGTVTRKKNDIEVKLSNGSYCATGIIGNLTITEGDCAPTIDTCPNCVFAFNTDEKCWISSQSSQSCSNETSIANYTNDYRTLNKNHFIGYLLNDNNEILKAYVCNIDIDTPFCIEGILGTNLGNNEDSFNRKYLEIKEFVLNIYGNSKCREDRYGLSCDSNLNTEIYVFKSGGARTMDINGNCTVDGYTGISVCSDYSLN